MTLWTIIGTLVGAALVYSGLMLLAAWFLGDW